MANADSGLIFVLDANLGGVPALLRTARLVAHDRVRTLPEMNIPDGTLDIALLEKLGREGAYALTSRDGRMLEPVLQRWAWREFSVSLFLLGKQWGTLPIGELTRRIIYLWPSIVQLAETSGLGAAWRVTPRIPEIPARSFRIVTGLHAEGKTAR
jgi:hypothetical protein